MTLWGRNGQSVTANSTTTHESSTGAPIGLWRYVDGGDTGTGFSVHTANANFGNTSPGARANVDVNMFDNTTPNAFINTMTIGVFGVSATQQQNNVLNHSTEHPAHAGWNLRRAGSGGIISVAYTGTATSYTNNDLIIVSSPVAGGNATFKISTNTSGGALTFTQNSAGFGFFVVNATANVVYANSTGGATTTGSGATFTATAGGRAGRVHYETIVAMGSLGAQSSPYGTPATTQSQNTTQFPGT
jgi:hypothetical protein